MNDEGLGRCLTMFFRLGGRTPWWLGGSSSGGAGVQEQWLTELNGGLFSVLVKNLGPTLSIFGLLFGPILPINVKTLMSGY